MGTILIWAGTVAGCGSPVPSDPDAPLRVSGLLRIQEPGLFEEDDPLQLQRPAAVLAHEGRVFIVENGGGRITVADSLLRPLNRFGRQGRGPGELSMPNAIIQTPGGSLAVSDAGNGRYAFFTPQGEFLHFVGDGGRHLQVGVLNDSVLVMAGPGGDEPRVLKATRNGVSAFSRALGPPEDPIHTTLDQTHVLETPAGIRVVVLRVGTGVVEVYDGQGVHLRNDTLPSPILKRLEERADGLIEAFQGPRQHVFGRKLVSKLASVTSDGRLLILLPPVGPAGLVYEPVEGCFRPLLVPEDDPRVERVLRSTGYAYLDGDRLYAVTASDAVGILQLEAG